MKCVKVITLDFKMLHSRCILQMKKEVHKGGVIYEEH